MKVNIHKCGHDNLTVESVHEASVPWDGVTKILDLKRTLEATGKEASEWSDGTGKDGESQCVLLKWMHEYLEAKHIV